MQPKAEFDIHSLEQLREVIPEPPAVSHDKIEASLLPSFAEFIALSPFVLVATVDDRSQLDISPKGDQPGFVKILDQTTLAIPERKGNRLAFGFQNILTSGAISLIFMIPGTRETLRINGRAHLNTDPELLQQLAADGKPALLATLVQVEEAFFHCGKALIRSELWQTSKQTTAGEASVRRYFSQRRSLSVQEVDQYLEADYQNER